MSELGFRVLAFSDSHVGYAAKCRSHKSGLNMREVDGMQALKRTVDIAINEQVDLVLHGGDLFHKSHPSITSIVYVQQQLQRLAKAGIPVVGNTGNHDASNERSKAPATAAVHDPDRGITMVTDPYQIVRPVEGLELHMLSHYGLAQAERVLPEPVDGCINILSAHGAAMVPGHEVFHCVDSPGEQPIGLDLLLDDRMAAKILGHYHGMGEVLPSVWYCGSAIRRGFSDPEGGRGALLLNIDSDGTVAIEKKFIAQRAQHDLPMIDAKGLTGADVEELIRLNLASVDPVDAIVRQVVKNCPTSVRRGIDQPAISKLMGDALVWQPDFRRPEVAADSGERTVEGVSSSLATAGAANLPQMWTDWAGEYAASNVAEALRPVVMSEGFRLLEAASTDVETGEYAAPAGNSGVPAQAHAAHDSDALVAADVASDDQPVADDDFLSAEEPPF